VAEGTIKVTINLHLAQFTRDIQAASIAMARLGQVFVDPRRGYRPLRSIVVTMQDGVTRRMWR
jgi:hypothetical protein